MGQVFCGYKGGDYVMGALTPVMVGQLRRLRDTKDPLRDDDVEDESGNIIVQGNDQNRRNRDTY